MEPIIRPKVVFSSESNQKPMSGRWAYILMLLAMCSTSAIGAISNIGGVTF